MGGMDPKLHKPSVTKSFNMASSNYESVAELQGIVAGNLFERLDLIRINPKIIIDLGAGTGAAAKKLAVRYKHSKIVELDIALQMLDYSKERESRFFSRHSYVCTDAESLAIADSSCDMIYSNLMLQWCNDLDRVFQEVRRVLKPKGLFIFSSLGPSTLTELRESWAAVDDYTHVNTFIDMHDAGDALIRAGLVEPVMEVEHFNLMYSDVYKLMRELKELGAQNANSGRRPTLSGKGRLSQMVENYEKWREAGKLPASYEVIYGHSWRGELMENTKKRSSTFAVPVSSIKRWNS